MNEEHRKYHEVANIFPLLQGAEFEALKADVLENGLLEPITIDADGAILDGRNRHRACIETGTPPKFVTWNGRGSLVAFVVSKNLHRRHLTYDQLVGIGLTLEPMFSEEAKERQRGGQGGVLLIPNSVKASSAEQAAKQVNVGKTALIEMKAIQKEQPDLAERLISGETTVRDERKAKNRQDRIEQIQAIEQSNEPLPQQKQYSIVYADPPWRYEHIKTENRAIENQYPTMSLNDICTLPIDDLTTDDAMLFLWATSPKLEEAMRVIKEWGFEYRTCMVWVKDKIGMGYYARQRHELLLIAKKGNIPVALPENRPDSVIEAPRTEHSSKPEIVYSIIEKMYPEYNRIELFSRTEHAGWDTWGNQVGGDNGN